MKEESLISESLAVKMRSRVVGESRRPLTGHRGGPTHDPSDPPSSHFTRTSR